MELLGGGGGTAAAAADGDDRSITGDLLQAVVELVLRDVQGALDAARLPLVGPADIEDLHLGAALLKLGRIHLSHPARALWERNSGPR